MKKTFISKEEFKTMKARLLATEELAKDYEISLTPFKYVNGFNPIELITAMSIERLDKSSNRLNRLTWVLLVLTGVLTIVGIVNIVLLIKSA